MRRLAFALVLLAALVGVGFAQDDPKKESPSPSDEMAQAAAAIIRGEIDLRDDQVEAVNAVLAKGMKHLFDQMAARERGEDVEDLDVRGEILDGLNGVLDDKQRAQLDALVKEFDTQSGRFESGSQEELDPNFDPSAIPDDKLAASAERWFEGDMPGKERFVLKAETALILSEDEKKIVLPRLEAVIVARRALRDATHTRRTDLGQAIHAGAKEDEVRERLHSMRGKAEELRGALEKAEEALREVVTIEQEARLVAIGVLD